MLNITEPVLSATLTVDKYLFDGGDVLAFKLTLRHLNSSSSDAKSVSMLVNTAFLLVSGTVSCNHPAASDMVSNQQIVVAVDTFKLEDNETVCNFSGASTVDISPNLVAEWIVNVTYYSAVPSGRQYNISDSTSALTKTIDFFKTVVMNTTASGKPLPTDPKKAALLHGIDGLAVAPGEMFYYLLYVEMPEVTTTLTFSVTVGEAEEETPVVRASFNISDIQKGGNVAMDLNLVNSLSANFTNTLSLYLGTVVNNPDNDESGDYVGVQISLNISSVSVGKKMLLLTILTFDEAKGEKSHLSSAVNVTVVAPDLSFLFALSGDPLDAGDSVVYSITIKHNGNSTGPARGLQLPLSHSNPFLLTDSANPASAVFSSDPNVVVALSADVVDLVALELLEVGNVTVMIPLILSNATRPGRNISTNVTLRYQDIGVAHASVPYHVLLGFVSSSFACRC